MRKTLLLFVIITLYEVGADDEELTSISPLSTTTLGKLFRQARSEYHSSRYGADGSSVTSGSIGIRGEPEHRDAAYYESRCITCDPNKSTMADRGSWRNKPRFDYYDEEQDERRYRYRYDDYIDRGRGPGYDYDRPRGSSYDYDRSSNSAYDYDPRMRGPMHDYDRYDAYGRVPSTRPLPYADRYDIQSGRDRYSDMRYERNYDRYSERGNGYDNLEQGYLASGNRYDPYSSPRRLVDDPYNSPRRPADDSYPSSRRPLADDPYMPRYDRYNNNYMNSASRYDPYEMRYEPYERSGFRRPYDDRRDRYDRYDRYERNPFRGGPDSRGYFSTGYWGPGYERGYASAWNYAGHRDSWREPGKERDPSDHWKDLHRDRDRDVGQYRPRDYFDDSTAQPGGLRGTSYRYDRPESSTKPDSTERDKPTSSPQTQDNKVYKD